MWDIIPLISVISSVLFPNVFLLCINRIYEDWKKNHGYVNNYEEGRLFKEDHDFGELERKCGKAFMFIPGVNLVVAAIMAYRRARGITLGQEIKAGSVALEEEPIVISEDEIEVIDSSEIPDDDQGPKRDNANFFDFASEMARGGDEDEEMADIFGELMMASLLASVFMNMGETSMNYNGKNQEVMQDDYYEFLKEFFDDDQSQKHGPRLRK